MIIIFGRSMKRSHFFTAGVLILLCYLSIAMLNKSSESFECKDKLTNSTMRVSLELVSPLMFWATQDGTLRISGARLFAVKRELGSLALYDGKSYTGSFDKGLYEIFINLPERIFEGKCQKI